MMFFSLALAQNLGTTHVALGNRFDPDGVGGAGGITESIVFGGDGGTYGTTVIGRYAAKRFAASVHVPFASYRTSTRRSTNLGNLRFEGFWRTESDTSVNLVGVEVHLPTGRAFTWTNDASSYWQSGGVTAVFQRRQVVNGKVQVLLRGALGLHATPGYAPVPRTYPHVSMAMGLDQSIGKVFGVTTEAAFSAWDPSPFDLAAWARLEPIDGFQFRVGGLMPVGTWLGASPSNKPGGLREGTLSLSLSLSP